MIDKRNNERTTMEGWLMFGGLLRWHVLIELVTPMIRFISEIKGGKNEEMKEKKSSLGPIY